MSEQTEAQKAQTDVLLRLRGQMIQLKRDLEEGAKEEQFALIPDVTYGTVFGVELALKMIDANLAIVTNDMRTLLAFLEGDDDAVGDGLGGQ
jgi:hypothetical protein